MALDKPGLKATIKALMTEMLEKEENSIDEFAERLSTAIDTYVKTGLVTVTVTTTGSATAQSGGGTGSIT
jgi:hypothetical protein